MTLCECRSARVFEPEDISKQERETNFQVTHACYIELLRYLELTDRTVGLVVPFGQSAPSGWTCWKSSKLS